MGVLMILTYDELAGATTFMADQLLATQDQVHDLTQQLVAAHIQVATLQGALEFEQQRSRGRIQVVVATAVCADLSSSSKASAGVLHPSVLRGRPFSVAATAARASALCMLRSVPLGKYCRSSPLVFSFVPRCQGLCGSQK